MKYLSIVVVMTGLVFLILGCGGGGDPVLPEFDTGSDFGTLNISMDDYKFTPERIDLVSCQKIRVILTNNSVTNDHVFTVGYGAIRQGDSTTGFENDWFEGVEVAVTGPVKMVKAGGAILTREDDGLVQDDASGFTVIKSASSQPTIIEFIVPITVGDFEFTSYRKYYKDGMKGLIKVFPMDLPPKGWAGAWRKAPDKCAS